MDDISEIPDNQWNSIVGNLLGRSTTTHNQRSKAECNFNLWMQRTLIVKILELYKKKTPITVVDVGLDRDDDIVHWNDCGIRIKQHILVEPDIKVANRSKSILEKLKVTRGVTFSTKHECGEIVEALRKIDSSTVDVIRCTNVFQHLMITEEAIGGFLTEVSRILKEGGIIFGTCTDAVSIMHYCDQFRVFRCDCSTYSWAIPWDIAVTLDEVCIHGCGLEIDYNYPEKRGPVREYLVPVDVVDNVARKKGLNFVAWRNFQDLFYEFVECENYRKLHPDVDNVNSFTADEWARVGLLCGFALAKTGTKL